MSDLSAFFQARGASFATVNGVPTVDSFGHPHAERTALAQSVGLLDLSCRSRLCVVGADRERFLNGQVTNNVKALGPNEGCYAAIITAKGKLQSDLFLYRLAEEFLLDFEPGLTGVVKERLEHYVIADDVQVLEVAPHYGLLSVQGPRAAEVLRRSGLFGPSGAGGAELPGKLLGVVSRHDEELGELYIINQPRATVAGFDLFIPVPALETAARRLADALPAFEGRLCGWQALECARLEAGIPRFGVDMDETNLAPEAGLDERAISYSKGCYIGQEVLARLRTYGQVAKSLRGLRLAEGLSPLPVKGDRLFQGPREVGYVTSALASPTLGATIALGYVRREAIAVGTQLILRTAAGDSPATIASPPHWAAGG